MKAWAYVVLDVLRVGNDHFWDLGASEWIESDADFLIALIQKYNDRDSAAFFDSEEFDEAKKEDVHDPFYDSSDDEFITKKETNAPKVIPSKNVGMAELRSE